MGSGTAAVSKPVPNGYGYLNWQGFYVVTSSPASQFLLPQGKNFAIVPNSPASTPAVIMAETEDSRWTGVYLFQPRSIFLGAFTKNLLGGLSAPSSPVIVNVTATTWYSNLQTWTIKIEPAKSVLGLALNAEAMQSFDFPCDWVYTYMSSMTFTAQAEDGANDDLVLAFDDFKFYPSSLLG